MLNACTTHRADLVAAEVIAERYGLTRSSGSDAHAPAGSPCLCRVTFDDAAPFLSALRMVFRGKLSSPLVHVSSTAARITKTMSVPTWAGQRYRSLRP